MPTLQLLPTSKHWLIRLKFPYGKGNFDALKEYIKSVPGSKWLGKPTYTWQFPMDMYGKVLDKALELGYEVDIGKLFASCKHTGIISPQLHEHQRTAVYQAFIQDKPLRFLLTDEAGLGKTAEAIEILKLLNLKRICIVCPASLVPKWGREVRKWWLDHPMIVDDFEDYPYDHESQIDIVSYNKLHTINHRHYEGVIFDEIHHLQTNTTGFTKKSRALLDTNPTAHAIGLSATIFPDRPRNLYSVVETLRPGSLGTFGKFSFRYTNPVEVDIGNGETAWEYNGVRNEDELRQRLGFFSVRTTKQEVLHLLQMPEVKVTRIPLSVSTVPKLQGEVREWLGSALNWACREKVAHVRKWVQESAATHKCIFVHHKELVKVIKDALKGEENLFAFTGSTNVRKRDEILEQTRDLPNAIVVATMHCVGEGLDLEHFQHCLFAELYYRPKTVIQAMNRFPRLNSAHKATIDFMILEGTADELVANSLLDKITDINMLQKAGVGEMKLLEALGAVDEDEMEEQIMQSLLGGMLDENS